MRNATVAELQELEESIEALVVEMPEWGEELEWAILKVELHDVFVDLRDIGERSDSELNWQIFQARQFILEAIRACEDRKLSAKHAVGEAAHCLNQAWHMLQDGYITEQ